MQQLTVASSEQTKHPSGAGKLARSASEGKSSPRWRFGLTGFCPLALTKYGLLRITKDCFEFDPNPAAPPIALEMTRAVFTLGASSCIEAVRRGYRDVDRMEADPDLAAVRSEREYRRLVADLREGH